ncbi:hypothetical protein G7Y89_g2563 [Cudoniella acicularis]|uniref:Uncharacterized protein n=1 Tax=Cudoniella acicularis TaxID=354080 RepID=A0A8H4RUZ5_9HELO|nr:hypothetical protein G7Y89_g2563 [Cudoniella acicularis]
MTGFSSLNSGAKLTFVKHYSSQFWRQSTTLACELGNEVKAYLSVSPNSRLTFTYSYALNLQHNGVGPINEPSDTYRQFSLKSSSLQPGTSYLVLLHELCNDSAAYGEPAYPPAAAVGSGLDDSEVLGMPTSHPITVTVLTATGVEILISECTPNRSISNILAASVLRPASHLISSPNLAFFSEAEYYPALLSPIAPYPQPLPIEAEGMADDDLKPQRALPPARHGTVVNASQNQHLIPIILQQLPCRIHGDLEICSE